MVASFDRVGTSRQVGDTRGGTRDGNRVGRACGALRNIGTVPASASDVSALTELLGRPPRADFEVVVRKAERILVIRNAPFLLDGAPMPTRYWLVDPDLARRVSAIESHGGVRAAESHVDRDDLTVAHAEYAAERDAAIDPAHRGPRPFGGVGGTRRGVKCLHAHYAYFLAGGNDPVGEWVAERLAKPETAS